ncbi:MAG: nucleoside transporter C-terminal domain-containing protein [Myxococcota bacterium]
MGQRALSCLGLGVFVLLGLALSRDRRAVSRRLVAWGLGLQLLFGLVVLKTAFGRVVFDGLNDAVTRLLGYTDEGSRFVFGPLMDEFSFALNVLPTILFFSALMTVLYHLGLMQRVVRGLARVLERTMGTSGSETLSAAANVFVGQTEAPLVVKPYLATMTRSELHAVMVGGFATVAGGVLAAYVGMLQERFPDIAGHLLAASVMSAPAALVMAKLMLPETEASPTAGGATLEVKSPYANVIDAAAQGAGEGLKLAANVAAMLLAFLALLALLNALLAAPVSAWNALAGAALEPVTLQDLLGWLFWPVAFVMGVAAEDCATVGMLLGEKIVLTEFVAYAHLAELLESGAPLQPRSLVIATYALCGFANFGSIAIQIGGIGALVPERRSELAELGLRAMVGGTLAACMTATVAGLLL